MTYRTDRKKRTAVLGCVRLCAPPLFLLFGLIACREPRVRQESAAQPLPAVQSGYAAGVRIELPERGPQEGQGLHRVFRLSKNIVAGAEPHGEEALRALAAMGVKTILSVDGKVPDHEVARRLGLRYVHMPIRYSAMTDEQVLRIAKTFRELPAPFFVHCFHGRHRGPAAAAIGRMLLDGVSRERVLAEMRQWCGTSEKYDEGLYGTIAHAALPSADETRAHRWDFPPEHRVGDFRVGMVDLTRTFDNVKLLARNRWEPDADNPDLDAYNEAGKLYERFTTCADFKTARQYPADFQEWMKSSLDASRDLRDSLKEHTDGDASAGMRAKKALRRLTKTCGSCHASYRNR